MKFNTTTTATAFIILLVTLVGGTAMIPMSTRPVAMVNIDLLVYGVLLLVFRIKHGEYRASHSGSDSRKQRQPLGMRD